MPTGHDDPGTEKISKITLTPEGERKFEKIKNNRVLITGKGEKNDEC